MNTSALLAALVALAFLPARADAQQMNLQIENGRVTLHAQNVPVRQILAEWARVGGATVVNGEKVVGAPVTLQLEAVPERQALDIILRGVSGYMLAARQTGTGVSEFDRILILATSSAPRGGSAPAPTAFSPASRRVPVMAEPTPTPTEDVVIEEEDGDNDNDNDEPEPGADENANEGVGEAGGTVTPPAGRFQRPAFPPNPRGAQMQPFVYPGQPTAPQQPQQAEDEDGTTQQQPATVTPFGVPVGSSTTPGVVTPVPQPQPGQPTPRRPPS